MWTVWAWEQGKLRAGLWLATLKATPLPGGVPIAKTLRTSSMH